MQRAVEVPSDSRAAARHPPISDDIPMCKPCTRCKLWQSADVPGPSPRRTPKPRSWIADPVEQKYFGKAKQLTWKVAPDGTYESSLIRAALMQHQIALHIHRARETRVAANVKAFTFAELGDRLHSVDYHGLMRLLRGDVPMGLHHAAELGTIFKFTVSTHWDTPTAGPRGGRSRR